MKILAKWQLLSTIILGCFTLSKGSQEYPQFKKSLDF